MRSTCSTLIKELICRGQGRVQAAGEEDADRNHHSTAAWDRSDAFAQHVREDGIGG
jgi:hypothetical protein